MTGQVDVNHDAMKKVCDRLDRLITDLGNSGSKGSYENMQGAAQLAYAVQSIVQPEIGTFVTQYNQGFGAAANDYRSLADSIVAIRNAVALTSNNHAANEQAQSAGLHVAAARGRVADLVRRQRQPHRAHPAAVHQRHQQLSPTDRRRGGSPMSGVGPIGDVLPGPIVPIPLNETIHIGTQLYDLASNWLGGGLTAGQLHSEMSGVDFGHLSDINSRLTSAHQYLGSGGLQAELDGILSDLKNAYDGKATEDMTQRFAHAKSDAENLSQKYDFLARRFAASQESLERCASTVSGYSRVGADVSNVTSIVGGDSQDDKARNAWNSCKADLGADGQSMSEVTP